MKVVATLNISPVTLKLTYLDERMKEKRNWSFTVRFPSVTVGQ